MKNTWGRAWLGMMGLCASLMVMAQDSPADFSVRLPLVVSGAGPWYRLELPLAVQLSARQSDLRDVRVFDAAGQPQAFALLRESAQRVQNRALDPVKAFPLTGQGDAPPASSVRIQAAGNGTLIEVSPGAADAALRGWLLDASAIKAPLHQLHLDWSGEREGFQRFSIEASDDLQHWRSWGEGQVARLSFAGERVEQREVALPGQSARYLRLLWPAGQVPPTTLSAQLASASPSTLPAPLAWSEPLAGSAGDNGEYTWQLPGVLALEQVRIELTQANSLAPVTLSGRSENNQGWRVLGQGLLYRLTQSEREVVQDRLYLPGQAVRQLKLQVDGRGGGLGRDAPRLSVAVRASQLIFLARGEGPYSLALGNATAVAANLPLSTLIPDYQPQRLEALGQARLDPGAVVPATGAAAPGPGIDWKRIGLWAVLLLGVLALGGMAISLLRQSNAQP